MSLNFQDPRVLCDWARDLGKTHPFWDFHVHPYDVLSEDTRYTLNPHTPGLFSRGLFKYKCPSFETALADLSSSTKPASDNERAFILSSRLTYNHTGPRVFLDQMELVGLSHALILPVARTPGKAESMLEAARLMFPQDERFSLGCAFPVGLLLDELLPYFTRAREEYGARVIKFHPNLGCIDPLTSSGQALIYTMLRSAGELHLPIILHTGRTPCIEPVESREFGMLDRLASIDWSLSSAPVIFAHCGLYGCTPEETQQALHAVKTQFDRHPNLMADISNLEPPLLKLVLQNLPLERLIFGSDALYIPIWKAWLRFLQALHAVSLHPEDDLVRLASLNPTRCLISTEKAI